MQHLAQRRPLLLNGRSSVSNSNIGLFIQLQQQQLLKSYDSVAASGIMVFQSGTFRLYRIGSTGEAALQQALATSHVCTCFSCRFETLPLHRSLLWLAWHTVDLT